MRAAAFAASFLVASLASAASFTETWTDWSASNQPNWPSIVDADGSTGGELHATGGGIYGDTAGNYYYTLFATPTLTLTPGAVLANVKTVSLQINNTWNPSTNGPSNVALIYNGTTVVYPTVSLVGDDFTFTWDLTGLGTISSIEIEWDLIQHSTFDELVLEQAD